MCRAGAALCIHRHADFSSRWESLGRLGRRRTGIGRTVRRLRAQPVTPEPLKVHTGPDERPKIAIDKDGRVAVAYTIFKDSAFNGQVFFLRSDDGGLTFVEPRPITADPRASVSRPSRSMPMVRCSRRGSTSAIAPRPRRGKRPIPAERWPLLGRKAPRPPSPTRASPRTIPANVAVSASLLADPDAQWCCSAISSAVRDHAVTTFVDPMTPGPINRVSIDDWAIDVCPHHGSSLAVGADPASEHESADDHGPNRSPLGSIAALPHGDAPRRWVPQ
jgi:hypothetical protein